MDLSYFYCYSQTLKGDFPLMFSLLFYLIILFGVLLDSSTEGSIVFKVFFLSSNRLFIRIVFSQIVNWSFLCLTSSYFLCCIVRILHSFQITFSNSLSCFIYSIFIFLSLTRLASLISRDFRFTSSTVLVQLKFYDQFRD